MIAGLLTALLAILFTTRAFWSLLNAGGAWLGRAIAWLASGGLGWKLARYQLDRLDLAWQLAELQRRSDAEWARVSRFLLPCDCAWCARSPGQRAAWD